MPTNDREYNARYQRETIKHYALNLHKDNDEKLIAWLQQHKPYTAYLRGLVQQDIERNGGFGKYHYEIYCDKFLAGSGFDTRYNILDTYDSYYPNVDIKTILSDIGFERIEVADGEDYYFMVATYDANGNQIDNDIKPIWQSEL